MLRRNFHFLMSVYLSKTDLEEIDLEKPTQTRFSFKLQQQEESLRTQTSKPAKVQLIDSSILKLLLTIGIKTTQL